MGKKAQGELGIAATYSSRKPSSKARWGQVLSYSGAALAGVLATLAAQQLTQSYLQPSYRGSLSSSSGANLAAVAPTGFHFPAASPTNGQYTTYFPSNIGYAGTTPTGNEAALVQTAPAYPVHTGAPNLVGPASIGGAHGGNDASAATSTGKKPFDIFKNWGNLSPWYSVPSSAFGLPDTSAEAPEGCRVVGLHFLHRHGARYPSEGGPEKFKDQLEGMAKQGKKWKAKGSLEFLNTWEYALGNELLTPFGRQQMYDLGINLRIKYGFLLNNFTDALPVFRTESQDRMLYSAANFAIGFFGYPHEEQYLNSITYQTPGVNNTLAPYMTCPNAKAKGYRGQYFNDQWVSKYLKGAAKRLQKDMDGMKIGTSEAYNFQQLCAYETVALGYSKFCELFTEEEWEGFEYAMDLSYWYNSAFGSPVARIQGLGYLQEMVARLTHTPIPIHNSTTNSTLDNNPITFPLNQALYVDATHEVVVLNIITALNLSNFAETGPLPSDHIPEKRSFVASQLAPFGTNMQFQLLSCDSTPGDQIRIIINDGVTPLTGIEGCPQNKHGLCPVDTFVRSQKKIIAETDWEWGCCGDWDVLPGTGWNTTTGDVPSRDEVGKDGSGVIHGKRDLTTEAGGMTVDRFCKRP
ncbi:hypothetical protein M407DRAFT_218939 [Tulasnella calospora MUT 4182]|uniref:Phosphoglycerate mutase-like protein n=1 Tax=Tulasnella calospora MUT 4182 TaxID=1051891 RepID=A0A0C3Q071_9AGAM|nr:hypothetical protein M407DRAFT_218939 [Tulasnella calospora MUT 4182]